MSIQKFFIRVQNQIKGPFTQAQVMAFAQKGQVRPEMLISPDGKRWFKAETVKGLFPDAGEVPEIELAEENAALPSLNDTRAIGDAAPMGVRPQARPATSASGTHKKVPTDALPRLDNSNELLDALGEETSDPGAGENLDETGKIGGNSAPMFGGKSMERVLQRVASLEEQVQCLRQEVKEVNNILQAHSLVLQFMRGGMPQPMMAQPMMYPQPQVGQPGMMAPMPPEQVAPIQAASPQFVSKMGRVKRD